MLGGQFGCEDSGKHEVNTRGKGRSRGPGKGWQIRRDRQGYWCTTCFRTADGETAGFPGLPGHCAVIVKADPKPNHSCWFLLLGSTNFKFLWRECCLNPPFIHLSILPPPPPPLWHGLGTFRDSAPAVVSYFQGCLLAWDLGMCWEWDQAPGAWTHITLMLEDPVPFDPVVSLILATFYHFPMWPPVSSYLPFC